MAVNVPAEHPKFSVMNGTRIVLRGVGTNMLQFKAAFQSKPYAEKLCSFCTCVTGCCQQRVV